MRLKALDLMEKISKNRQYSFSVLYSSGEESRRKIQTRFLEFIDWVQKETQAEAPAHVYQLNFDLLKWTID
jgi:hypothetical protein